MLSVSQFTLHLDYFYMLLHTSGLNKLVISFLFDWIEWYWIQVCIRTDLALLDSDLIRSAPREFGAYPENWRPCDILVSVTHIPLPPRQQSSVYAGGWHNMWTGPNLNMSIVEPLHYATRKSSLSRLKSPPYRIGLQY